MHLIDALLSEQGKERRLHAWKELQQAKAEGRVRSIGVSNFSVKSVSRDSWLNKV